MGTNIYAIVYFTQNGGNTENISTSSQHPISIFSLLAVEFVESPSLEASHFIFHMYTFLTSNSNCLFSATLICFCIFLLSRQDRH